MESVIYNADCLNIMKDISDNSINLVCVDLPYGQTSCKWDIEIDLDKMWIELKRIGKKNCQYLFFCTTKFGYTLIKSNEKWFRQDIVWHKNLSVGFLTCKKMLMRSHEMIYLFHNTTKPKELKWTYNPQMIEGEPYIKRGLSTSSKIYNPKKQIMETIINKGLRYPSSVQEFKKDHNKTNLHPTQKPVLLCEWLIKTYSNEGDVVLDFTMGSGSTIIACINTNRRYVGIEKDEKIFKLAEDRINKHKTNLVDNT